jgi:hypothetical protein
LTDEVSITPTPNPTSNRPGTNVSTLEVARARSSDRKLPAIVVMKPSRMRVAWVYRRASWLAASDDARIPIVAGVRIRPVSIAPNAPGARLHIIIEDRGEVVGRWNQQGGSNALAE